MSAKLAPFLIFNNGSAFMEVKSHLSSLSDHPLSVEARKSYFTLITENYIARFAVTFALVLTSYFHRVHRTTPDTLSEAFNGLFTLKGKNQSHFVKWCRDTFQ